jgi:hypothetical protein
LQLHIRIGEIANVSKKDTANEKKMKRINSKKLTKASAKLALGLILFLSTTPALSAIPYRNAFEAADLINEETKELNLSLLAKIQVLVDQNQFNMGQYIPFKSLPSQDDGTIISRRILQHTMRTVFNSETQSKVIQGAQNLNSALSTSIDRNGHSFSFRVKALEGTAEFVYRGRVEAALSFNNSQQETRLDVSWSF